MSYTFSLKSFDRIQWSFSDYLVISEEIKRGNHQSRVTTIVIVSACHSGLLQRSKRAPAKKTANESYGNFSNRNYNVLQKFSTK